MPRRESQGLRRPLRPLPVPWACSPAGRRGAPRPLEGQGAILAALSWGEGGRRACRGWGTLLPRKSRGSVSRLHSWAPCGKGVRGGAAVAPGTPCLASEGRPPGLGVGRPAGAAAGLAVVPVAAEVHLDGQGAVGARLVLAAVIWGRDRSASGGGGAVGGTTRQDPRPAPSTSFPGALPRTPRQ